MSDVKVARLPEKFDFSFHKKFNEDMDAALKDQAIKEIHLDFSAVNYLDSAALGMIVYLHKKSSAVNKSVRIIHASGTAEEILKVANIERIVPLG
ncbi:STAS domain-containing protein [Marinospirillum perlucidum]|uniref:STAS domain-containing protein n=1 Tax=Marinospirillum perlucidum TaxID=1982602 RepID=UPI000DF3385C|nr:STAS domain-containing protein [Marinospirillum perlucidum]